MQSSLQLRTRKGTETYKESYTVSTTKWYLPWTWFDDDVTCYRTRTRSYEYLAVADAVESAKKHEHNAVQSIESGFNKLLDKRALIRRLREALEKTTGHTKDNAASVEAAVLKSALDDALKQLQWPPFKMPDTGAAKAISLRFSGEVRGSSDMERLKEALKQVQRDICQRLSASFDAASKPVFAALQQVQTSLHATLSASLQQALGQAKRDFADKEQQLARYMSLHQTLHAMQQDLDALLQE